MQHWRQVAGNVPVGTAIVMFKGVRLRTLAPGWRGSFQRRPMHLKRSAATVRKAYQPKFPSFIIRPWEGARCGSIPFCIGSGLERQGVARKMSGKAFFWMASETEAPNMFALYTWQRCDLLR